MNLRPTVAVRAFAVHERSACLKFAGLATLVAALGWVMVTSGSHGVSSRTSGWTSGWTSGPLAPLLGAEEAARRANFVFPIDPDPEVPCANQKVLVDGQGVPLTPPECGSINTICAAPVAGVCVSCPNPPTGYRCGTACSTLPGYQLGVGTTLQIAKWRCGDVGSTFVPYQCRANAVPATDCTCSNLQCQGGVAVACQQGSVWLSCSP